MKNATKSWLSYAEKDLLAAQRLNENKGLESVVLFHCQQSVEKILKAVLEENNIEVPKIHATRTLFELLPKKIQDRIIINKDFLIEIDAVYIDSRYPGHLGILPNGNPTQKEVNRIMDITEQLFSRIKEVFGDS